MEINIEKWKYDLRHQRKNHLVSNRSQSGEKAYSPNAFGESLAMISCIPTDVFGLIQEFTINDRAI